MYKKSLYFIAVLVISIFITSSLSPSGASFDNKIDQEIEGLNNRIHNQRKQIEELQRKQREYRAQITAKQNEQVSLSNQLAIIENRLGKTELDIEEASLEIEKIGLEIRKVEIDSENIDIKIELKKEHISNLLRAIYKQEQASTLETLLLNNSLSDFLNKIKYLEDANAQIGESVRELKAQKDLLERNQTILKEKGEELIVLRNRLAEKRDSLSYEQDQKTNILDQTKSSEKEFQALLAQARTEQRQAQTDISRAESLIRQKLSEKERDRLEGGDSTIAWPVAKNFVTATFHDPDYPFRRVIGEHSGIDIRAAQGSRMYAAADGYVAKVRADGSKRYAYIMIIHANNLSTVYGHISAAYVTVDQYVTKGQLIGKTGGTPGTTGAGRFSTGPHLHFEVRKNGIPVNPLNYLP